MVATLELPWKRKAPIHHKKIKSRSFEFIFFVKSTDPVQSCTVQVLYCVLGFCREHEPHHQWAPPLAWPLKSFFFRMGFYCHIRPPACPYSFRMGFSHKSSLPPSKEFAHFFVVRRKQWNPKRSSKVRKKIEVMGQNTGAIHVNLPTNKNKRRRNLQLSSTWPLFPPLFFCIEASHISCFLVRLGIYTRSRARVRRRLNCRRRRTFSRSVSLRTRPSSARKRASFVAHGKEKKKEKKRKKGHRERKGSTCCARLRVLTLLRETQKKKQKNTIGSLCDDDLEVYKKSAALKEIGQRSRSAQRKRLTWRKCVLKRNGKEQK